MAQNEPVLRLCNITKYFTNVKALDDVSFELYPGEVVGLIGENGAGKSTLINIVSGVYQPDKGEIYVNGNRVYFKSPQDAFKLGVTVIHQELTLAEDLDVGQNIFLGEKPIRRVLGLLKVVDYSTVYRESEELLRKFGCKVSPKALVAELSPTERQLLEIAKGMRRRSRIFLMDEPTAGLDEREVSILLDYVDLLRKQGVAIIYVSHALEDVEMIADRIVVLRDGKKVGDVKKSQIDTKEIVRMMVGHELVSDQVSKRKQLQERVVLTVRNVATLDEYVRDVSFNLYEGEILGLAGITASGRSELLRALYGIGVITHGQIQTNGYLLRRIKNTREARRLGFAFLSRDRKREGIFGIRDVRENITIGNLNKISSKVGFISRKVEYNVASEVVHKLGIVTPSLFTTCESLSGGNQQKVILGRWITAKPKILLCDEPTRGIDVGAKEEVIRILRSLSEEGMSIIISSSEVPELMRLCDRILVMFEGKVVKEFQSGSVTKAELVRYIVEGE